MSQKCRASEYSRESTLALKNRARGKEATRSVRTERSAGAILYLSAMEVKPEFTAMFPKYWVVAERTIKSPHSWTRGYEDTIIDSSSVQHE
ncbi:unnamed protein product [Clonostachys chloroleuca]|uniref:Uncharacterized protein n=1 Tax=Clonostachys chloroleuca TaxID=1926264 RepID=A0AA35M6F5_9HYPO|nr:unnamed protein product [Clonostachys chloroleuca]